MHEYHYKIFADYFQVIFADVAAIDSIGAENYRIDFSKPLVTSATYFTINTLRNYEVAIAVNLLTSKPDMSRIVCDIKMAGEFECRSGTVAVMSVTSYIGDIERFDLPKGKYNIMLCVSNTKSIDSNQTEGEELYKISFWPLVNH